MYEFTDNLAREFGFSDFSHQQGVGGVREQYEFYGPAYGFSSGTLADLLLLHDRDTLMPLAYVVGFLEAIVFGLALGSVAWTRYAIAVVLTARRRGLPRRLGPFVDWAYHAGVLRVSGIAYQFRHLELQHWLTRQGGVLDPGSTHR